MAESVQQYLTIDELADLLRWSPSTVRNRRAQRKDLPPSVKIGNRILFPLADVEAWIAEHREPAEASP